MQLPRLKFEIFFSLKSESFSEIRVKLNQNKSGKIHFHKKNTLVLFYLFAQAPWHILFITAATKRIKKLTIIGLLDLNNR